MENNDIYRGYIDPRLSLVIRIILVILGMWLLYEVRDVLALFFLSVVLTATFDPFVDWMQRKKIPRSVSMLIIYVAVFLVLGAFLSFLIPALTSQVKEFSDQIPQFSRNLAGAFNSIDSFARTIGVNFNVHDFLSNSFPNMNESSGTLVSTTVGLFATLISIVVVMALTFYMSVKENSMKRFLLSLTPKGRQQYVASLTDRIKMKIGKWMFGQIMLMIIIFALDFIALSILHVPFALALAVLAGLLEIIPYLGPIISAIVASLIGFSISPLTGLITLATLTLIQQLESHVIVPLIMKKAVGLNPVVVILSLLVGAKLGGVIGALLAIPVATAIGVIVTDILHRKEEREAMVFEENA